MENVSKRVFLFRPDNQRLRVLDGLLDGDNPPARGSFPVGSNPGNVAVQNVAVQVVTPR